MPWQTWPNPLLASLRTLLDRYGVSRWRLLYGGAALIIAGLAVTLMHAHGSGRRDPAPAPTWAMPSPRATTTPRITATVSATPTPSPSPTATLRPTASSTPSPSPTKHPPTATPSLTVIARDTATPTARPSNTPSPTPRPTATPIPTATIDPVYYAEDTLLGTGPGLPGPLSGLPTTPARADRRPVAVVLDNYAPDARPQTGLNRASLVFETLAEGGVTRLMAVYLERDAPVVGPVRSARIYFDAWAAGLHAVFAHAGGNNDALYELGHSATMRALANLDGLNIPVAPASQPYWRSPDRAAPHNLYTATTSLRAYALAAGSPVYGAFTAALPHRVPDPSFHRPDRAWIDVAFSSDAYNVHWTYDRTSNSYLRAVRGITAVDPLSRRAVAASNVVVLFTRVTPDPDPFTPQAVDVHAVGGGRALYFRDGHLVQGRWQKASDEAPLVLLDPHGQLQPFNPGQTWIEVVPLGAGVTWHGT